mgnify:CR=1 FL=1
MRQLKTEATSLDESITLPPLGEKQNPKFLTSVIVLGSRAERTVTYLNFHFFLGAK